ncbi:MAG TPA: tripartite tricarboxylate transporter substrate-binding protein [Bosea sp. (in: a-proteobacteria)]|jgi:tripartite-type tricarboxylate transporter receptor subunit TctC|uniref:Bug family tripartite tricarboxylate transporter substrate binding protein n=1 Tax=Bosea sp. (in: a-proteobacteria) TaxID=1871050 RepID=UPI002E12955E|nr:tripartite tricarboxylate transporter substrate-binding protein [Bosea sp. (in: a-proteobacteria)]
MDRRQFIGSAAAAATGLGLSVSASAQDLPPGPIRMIVGFAAGGSTDAMARLIGERLSQRLNRSVIIENNAGASGRLAAEQVKKAAPDGSTVLIGNIGLVVLAPVTFKSLSYDVFADFEPVVRAADFQLAVAASQQAGAVDLAGFIDWLKKNSDKANLAVPLQASLSHLTGLRFVEAVGAKVEMVVFRGMALAMQDVLAGRLSGAVATVADFSEQHRAGTLKVMAVSGAGRSPALPDVPTFTQAGIKGFESNGWNGYLLPKGTPQAIVELYNREISAIVASPEIAQRYEQLGFVAPEPNTPAQFAATIKAGMDAWRPLVAAAGLQQ